MVHGKVLGGKKHFTLLTHVGSFFLHALHLPCRFTAIGRCLLLPNLTAFTELGVDPELAGFKETCSKILRTISLIQQKFSRNRFRALKQYCVQAEVI